MRQGEPGDVYYAIGTGELDVLKDGHFVSRCGRGDGVGEIALLRDVPRTATVTARTPATVYQLSREPFLTAVLGHAPTHHQAARIADARLGNRATPREDTSGTSAAEPS
jgi:CRP-like cAMP-binding protein